MDDELVEHMYEVFPELKFEDALRVLDEDKMKSRSGKEKWRNFIMAVRLLSTPCQEQATCDPYPCG
jgi:hypothetical protein